jgi:hypothetical protein
MKLVRERGAGSGKKKEGSRDCCQKSQNRFFHSKIYFLLQK